MTTIVEQTPSTDSGGGWAALVVVLLLIIGLVIAYFNGAFTTTDKTSNTTIEHKTVNITVPAAPSTSPDSAPKQ